jgi:hypothetical protein
MKRRFLIIAFLLLANVICFAQNDEASVASIVEKLRVAIVDANEAELNKLTSSKLTYGHSNGLIEDKKEFVRAIISGESNFTKIDLSEQSVSISGDVALVRHNLAGETHNKGKEPGTTKLGVLMVFQKTKGSWLLLARQAFKLP